MPQWRTYSGVVSGATVVRSFTEVARTPANTFQVLQPLPGTITQQTPVYTPLMVRLLDPYGVALRVAGVTITGTGVVTPVDSGPFVFAAATDTGGVATLYLPLYFGPLGMMTITLTAPGTTPLVLPPITIVAGMVSNGMPRAAPGGIAPVRGAAGETSVRRAGTRPTSRDLRPH